MSLHASVTSDLSAEEALSDKSRVEASLQHASFECKTIAKHGPIYVIYVKIV